MFDLKNAVCAALCILATFSVARDLQALPESEHATKARYIFSFLKFMHWPDNTSNDLYLCTFGKTDLDLELSKYKGEYTAGRKVVIKTAVDENDAKQCHLLFVGHNNMDKWRSTLSTLKDKPVVTVGDAKGFSYKGGMIEFIKHKERLRFMINQETTKAKSVEIDSKLLLLGF